VTLGNQLSTISSLGYTGRKARRRNVVRRQGAGFERIDVGGQ
jgi:hypothetical protein